MKTVLTVNSRGVVTLPAPLRRPQALTVPSVRIFLHANVQCSAAKSDGAVRELLRRLVSFGHRLCADPYVAPDADAVLDWLAPKDRPVLAAAIHARCDVLVTGDRTHFGVAWGGDFGGVTILSPAMLAERMRAESGAPRP